jgi:BarA-like signal transduction histidine kinase
VKGSKSISFPKLTSFSVSNRTEGSAGDASALTATVDQLSLNVLAYVAYVIDSVTAQQANIQVELEYAKRAAAAHGRYVDSQIISALASAAASFENVGADVDVTYANLLSMRKKLMQSDANMMDCVILASPAQESVLFGLDEFKRADVYGQGNIPTGVIGRILGMPVFVHNGLADKQLFMYEKSGLAIGFQQGAQMSEQGANEYGSGAKRVAIDQLFGLKALETGLKGASAGKSPLIRGLND